MTEVCIIGIGIHKFGRTDGRSGRDQGVFAVRQALADAKLGWSDIQFAFGGSSAGGSADLMVNELGLTGLPFVNVANGCATGGSALAATRAAIASGEFDIGLAVGFDKHDRGAFDPKARDWGQPDWYGEAGFMLTTQFFAMKLQRYMALHGIAGTHWAASPQRPSATASMPTMRGGVRRSISKPSSMRRWSTIR